MEPSDLDIPDLTEGDTFSKKGDTYQWLQHLERRGGTLVVSEIMLNTRFGYLAAVKRRTLSGAEAAACPALLPPRGFARLGADQHKAAAELVARYRTEALRRLP
jgi:hypothetical protein